MSYGDIKAIRARFGRMPATEQSLLLGILSDDVNSARTAKARAAIGKTGKRRGRKPKEQPAVAAVS
jgi:hypothetical protein